VPKLLLAVGVVAGIIFGAAHFMHSQGPAGPVRGPTVVTVQVPNPLGGSGTQGGQVVIQ